MRQAVAVSMGALTAFGLLCSPGISNAEPPKSPYPDTKGYAQVDIEAYRVGQDRDNVWFKTPFGLNCGIWADGSFGCTGAIPGAPAGTNQVGWFPGDYAAHFDETEQPRFTNPNGLPQPVLPRRSYIVSSNLNSGSSETSTCAVTDNGSVYCFKSGSWKGAGGAYYSSQFIVGPSSSYLGAPPQ